MTTNELIEKYGIGHNCLADAYALGMMDGLDALENAVELAEEKARVDAIEECIRKITNEHTHSCYNDDVYECIKLLEQLKEQKNE